jgi:hypothetical protein
MSGVISTALAWKPLSTVILDEDVGADKDFFISLLHLSQTKTEGAKLAFRNIFFLE